MPPRAPYSMPARRAPRRGRGAARSRRPAGRWSAAGPSSRGVAAAQRAHQGRRGDRLGHVVVAAQPVALGIHRRGRQAALGEGEDPVVGAAGQHRREHARRGRCPSRCRRRRGTARRCPSSAPSSSISSRSRSRAHRWSSATRVAAASAEPPAMPPVTGMPLRIEMCTGVDVETARHAGGPRAGRGCRRPVGRRLGQRAADAHPPVVGDGHRDVVVEAHGVEDRGQAVVAVGATRTDEQLEVDLGRDARRSPRPGTTEAAVMRPP